MVKSEKEKKLQNPTKLFEHTLKFPRVPRNLQSPTTRPGQTAPIVCFLLSGVTHVSFWKFRKRFFLSRGRLETSLALCPRVLQQNEESLRKNIRGRINKKDLRSLSWDVLKYKEFPALNRSHVLNKETLQVSVITAKEKSSCFTKRKIWSRLTNYVARQLKSIHLVVDKPSNKELQ